MKTKTVYVVIFQNEHKTRVGGVFKGKEEARKAVIKENISSAEYDNFLIQPCEFHDSLTEDEF